MYSEKMLKIVAFASLVSAVCGAQYAYYDNNLVEFDDPPAPVISLPYPYKQPKMVKIDTRPAVAYGVGVQTAIVSSPPASTSLSKLDLILAPFRLVCSAITCIVGSLKRMITYFITSVPAFIFGGFSSLGIYKLSAVCKFFNIDPMPYVNGITSLVTPDRLKRATEFVESAINKYKELQNV